MPTTTDAKRQDSRVNGIPAALAAYKSWVGYVVNEHFAKIPIDPDPAGYAASSVDPDTWGDAHLAVGSLYSHRGRFWDGLGFMLSGDDPYTMIDIDDCVEGDVIHPWVLDQMERWGGWWQFSVSGTGVHCIVETGRAGLELAGRYYSPEIRSSSPTRADKARHPMRVEVFWQHHFVPFSGRPILSEGAEGVIRRGAGLVAESLSTLVPIARSPHTGDPRASAAQVVHGERHHYLTGLAGSIARLVEDRDEVRNQIEAAAEAMPAPLPAREIEGIVNWALNLEPNTSKGETDNNYYSTKRSLDASEQTKIARQALAIGTVGYECHQVAQTAFSHIEDVEWQRNPRKWYRNSPIYKEIKRLGARMGGGGESTVTAKCKAPTAWGHQIRSGNVVGTRLNCGDWSCHRCGAEKKTTWWYDLANKICLVSRLYHNVLDDEQWSASQSSRSRLRAARQPCRSWRTDRGYEVLSSEPLTGRKFSADDKLIEVSDRPQLLLDIMSRMRLRRHKTERLISGSAAWGPPPRAVKTSEDYEFLGVGPSPDQAAAIARRELKLSTALTNSESQHDGTTIHWSAVILVTPGCGMLDLVVSTLGIHLPKRYREPVLAPVCPPWDRPDYGL